MTPKQKKELGIEVVNFHRYLYMMGCTAMGMGLERRKKGEKVGFRNSSSLVSMGNILNYAVKFLRRNVEECEIIMRKYGWKYDRPDQFPAVHARIVAYSEPLCNKCNDAKLIETRYQFDEVEEVKKQLATDFKHFLRAGELYGNYAIHRLSDFPENDKITEHAAFVFHNSRSRLRWGYGCTFQTISALTPGSDHDELLFDVMKYDSRLAKQLGWESTLCADCEGKLINVQK